MTDSAASAKSAATAGAARLPGFYRLPVSDRIQLLHERGLLSTNDARLLATGRHRLTVAGADKMVENVVGVLGLPMGLGINFLINDRDYVVPLAVEEPSIVAALSSAAKLVRSCGGFRTRSTPPILIGQVQAVDVAHARQAQAALLQRRQDILNLANSLHPRMVARGGGAEDLEVHIHAAPDGKRDMVVLHLLVNTCDAMGANVVNTMCEGVAPLVEAITGGRVVLRILSNLTDRSLVWAEAVIPVAALGEGGRDGERVRDGIIWANDLATVDPYRAATHNKGIMNGVDAVALATGNDWRALEAAAHVYAARGQSYTSLTKWSRNERGDLVGSIEMPMQVGTVGGNLQSNPTVGIAHRLLQVGSSRELAEVMGAVGLAQNLSALRALVTDGIQQGHMTLHARSVAMAARTPPGIFNQVVQGLLESGDIKVWKAREIMAELEGGARLQLVRGADAEAEAASWSAGHGKVILFGEHAVVYGRHAIAAPVPLAIRARARDRSDGTVLTIPRWGMEQRLPLAAGQPARSGSFMESLALILQRLELTEHELLIEVDPQVPRAMGLGASAALAVAVIRALDRHCGLSLSEAEISALAFECEKIAHGTPSGIDNTVATCGHALLYQTGNPPRMERLQIARPLPLVIGFSRTENLTARTVARVREAWQRNPGLYESIFDAIDRLSLQALDALRENDLQQLGELMNICQGQLNALQISTWELEEMTQIARAHGAAGAKLTGGGGGGSIIALCPDGGQAVIEALQQAGYGAMEIQIG